MKMLSQSEMLYIFKVSGLRRRKALLLSFLHHKTLTTHKMRTKMKYHFHFEINV